jgi:hypothetical protein
MTSNSSFCAAPDRGGIQSRKSEKAQQTILRLKDVAVNGLVPMFDVKKQLFCFKLKQTATGLVREGISPRYTVITLMGLHRLQESGTTSPIEINRVFDGLLANTDWVDNIGDLGLLLWLCALMAPDRLDEVDRRLEVKTALTRFRDGRQGHTMELAWFLSGLSHGSLARPHFLPESRDLAFETYRRLIRNQDGQGLFCHVVRNKSIAGMLRGGIGSFADQVYPIYAMTKFSQAYQFGQATERALDCALTICEAQGSRGQWWWHYNSSAGRVVDGFPIFSVHQHGMGPMTLFTLGEAIQSDFSPWIYKGLQWISDNELGFDMEDISSNIIWRSIACPAPTRCWNAAIGALTQREHRESCHGLKVTFECRPYELGWLLYAFADKEGQSPTIHFRGPSGETASPRP